MIEPSSILSLHNAASLLGLDDYDLKNGLTTRVMQPTKGGIKGTIIRCSLTSFVCMTDVNSRQWINLEYHSL